MPTRPRVLALVGATATGKTAVGEALAERLGAEVVCADSRQVFRELEIGSGKPDPAARRRQPHHLFDALAIGQRASAGWYARAAAEACRGIWTRGRLPLLVGGSGLYLKALTSGLAQEPPHDPALRARLQAELVSDGPEALHRRLATCDPEAAARLGPRDGRRITRALEVWEASGRPISWWQAQDTRPELDADWRVVELHVAPATLALRIAHRTRDLFERGLVEETRALVASGRGAELARLRAIGYDEALALLSGSLSREQAEARTRLRTRQLAKRQRTWFRHQVRGIGIEAASGSVDELAGAALAAVGA